MVWEPLLTHASHSNKNLGLHICLDILRIIPLSLYIYMQRVSGIP